MIKHRTLIEALEAAPSDRTFLTYWVDGDEQEIVTFGEFRRRASAQARVLQERGVVAGDKVVVVMPQGILAMTEFVAAMMLGAVPAFLAYPNFKVEPAKYQSGLSGVTANLQAKVVVIDDEFPDELLDHISQEKTAELLRVGRSHGASNDGFSVPDLQSESIAFIQHSAGTTGLQKGVALSHAAVINQLQHLANAVQIDPDQDRIYNWLPLYHDMGLIASFMLPMVYHLPVVLQSPLDWVMQPESMLQIITEHKCSLAWLPNFAFQFVPRRVPRNRWSQYDLSSVRALINCSEPIRASSLEEFYSAFELIGIRRTALQCSYAMAENVFAVTQSNVQEEPPTTYVDSMRFRSEHLAIPVAAHSAGSIAFVSSGRILTGNELRIVAENQEPLSEGMVGEILIRSDSLFQGYYNRPDLTEIAIRNGWYSTGDLGFLLGGELYVVGRKKDVLIVRGENLYPQDIEESVSRHPAIHDGRVIAFGVLNPEFGTDDVIVIAEVESEEQLANREVIESEIRRFVVADLGVAVRNVVLKPPKWIVKSTAGKAARAATREKFLREHPELADHSEESYDA